MCVRKRQLLDEVEKEMTRLGEKSQRRQKELDQEEQKLVTMSEAQVDMMKMQLEGKKKQKLDYDQQLQRKKNALDRAQLEYAQFEVQLKPLIEGAQGEIDNLQTLANLSAKVNSPKHLDNTGLVESIAETDLPSMSSG